MNKNTYKLKTFGLKSFEVNGDNGAVVGDDNGVVGIDNSTDGDVEGDNSGDGGICGDNGADNDVYGSDGGMGEYNYVDNDFIRIYSVKNRQLLNLLDYDDSF